MWWVVSEGFYLMGFTKYAHNATIVCVCVCVCLCQFRDNILLATNLPPSTSTTLVNMVASTLSEVWSPEVLCPCLDGGAAVCEGACLSNTVRALGISMTVGGGVGIRSAHPLALTNTWALRHGKPLITPCRAAPEYLPCIFSSSLTGALPWQTTWAAQILAALAWAQVALASNYFAWLSCEPCIKLCAVCAVHPRGVRKILCTRFTRSPETSRAPMLQ